MVVSKCFTIRSLVKIVLSLTNSTWYSGNHKRCVPSQSTDVETLYGVDSQEYRRLIGPRKERTPVWSLCVGKFAREATRSGSGCTPACDMTQPANFRLDEIWNLLCEGVDIVVALHVGILRAPYFPQSFYTTETPRRRGLSDSTTHLKRKRVP